MIATRREKFFFYNRLSILLKAIEKERTTIDLRNEASAYGIVDQVDGLMNVVMRDCTFTDPRGDSYNFDMFFVLAKNIRCVHVPPNIRIIPAIEDQLQLLSGHKKEDDTKKKKWTHKQKKTLEKQLEGLAAMETVLKERKESQIMQNKYKEQEYK